MKKGSLSPKPGVMFYFDMLPALELLNKEQKADLFDAILAFGKDGTIPSFNDSLLNITWRFIQPALERDDLKYRTKQEQAIIAGITSDFKKNYAPKHGIDPNDESELQKYICQQMPTPVDNRQAITATKSFTPTLTAAEASLPSGDDGGRDDILEAYRGNVMLTEQQEEILLDKLGLEAFDRYLKKLSDYISKNGDHFKSHFSTMLKWANEDRRT